jgi:hypothetical protein
MTSEPDAFTGQIRGFIRLHIQFFMGKRCQLLREPVDYFFSGVLCENNPIYNQKEKKRH